MSQILSIVPELEFSLIKGGYAEYDKSVCNKNMRYDRGGWNKIRQLILEIM